MSTPFQKYLLEAINDVSTPPGYYYDPIRNQSVKGDKPTLVPNDVVDNDGGLQTTDPGPRPEFDWEITLVENTAFFIGLLTLLLNGEFRPFGVGDSFWNRIMGIIGRTFANLPENPENWQDYFDGILEQNGIEGFAGHYLQQIVSFLTEIVENGVPLGEYNNPFGDGTVNLDKPMSEYVQWHFNQYFQQLIDFLSDYEYGG